VGGERGREGGGGGGGCKEGGAKGGGGQRGLASGGGRVPVNKGAAVGEAGLYAPHVKKKREVRR